jgi:hypothetical protein
MQAELDRIRTDLSCQVSALQSELSTAVQRGQEQQQAALDAAAAAAAREVAAQESLTAVVTRVAVLESVVRALDSRLAQQAAEHDAALQQKQALIESQVGVLSLLRSPFAYLLFSVHSLLRRRRVCRLLPRLRCRWSCRGALPSERASRGQCAHRQGRRDTRGR